MMKSLSLIFFLFLFWLALSGHYTIVLISAGLASAILCALAARWLRTLDDESQPLHLLTGAVTYFPWLLWEIVKSAWSVTRIILDPKLPISPTMTRLAATQKGPAALATYANSITLTPGTLTVGVSGNTFLVHALTREGAEDLEAGHMDRRVTRFEGKA